MQVNVTLKLIHSVCNTTLSISDAIFWKISFAHDINQPWVFICPTNAYEIRVIIDTRYWHSSIHFKDMMHMSTLTTRDVSHRGVP